MPPSNRTTENLHDLRLRSRQQYLEKREAEQLALLTAQVAEEEQELLANGPNLSEKERQEFARNKTTLRLAQERLNISDHFDGYQLPGLDVVEDKTAVLNSRNRDEHKSEFQIFEDEQARAARGWTGKSSEKVNAGDYDYVFDVSQGIKFAADAASRLDPERQQFEKRLDEAETKVRSMEETRRSLPIFEYRESLLEAIAAHQVVICVAETGSGKSTQIAQYLWESGANNGLRIAVTQPRRVAAMSVAARVAEEVGCKLGTTVGYSVRFDDKLTDSSKICFFTDGILLQLVLADPGLSEYSVIIIDEAHERALATDILLAIVKDLAKLRKSLRIIIASATVDAQSFSSYFGDAPIFNIPGRRYPVEILYTSSPEASYLAASITTVMQIHISQPVGGDILVFLTGQDEIEACCEALSATMQKLGSKVMDLIVCPIYANLPSSEQNKIFDPTPPHSRKVIVATNIAETSLTIPNISYVVDCGLSKINEFNPRTGMESLVVTPCSRANANQRAGRAGRTSKGLAFRLFTKWSFYNELEANPTPEIQRCNVSSAILLLKSLGINDLLSFDFMSPPNSASVIGALETLYGLGALDDRGQLTRIGRKMASIPVAVDLARTILAADEYGCVDEVLSIVAMLSESSALFIRPKEKRVHADAARARFTSKEGGDHLTLLAVWNQFVESGYDTIWCMDNFLQYKTLSRVRDIRDQLVRLTEKVEVELSSNSDHVKIRKSFCKGFFTKAARLSRGGDSYRTAKSGQTLYIHPSSVCMEQRPRWILYYEAVLTSKEYMRNVIPVEPEWLTEAAPFYYKPEDLEKLGVNKKVGKTKG